MPVFLKIRYNLFVMSEVRHQVVGMDPRIEQKLWHDFHPSMIVAIRSALIPLLIPRYTAIVEERIYIEHHPNAPHHIRPDITVRTEQPRARPPQTEVPIALDEPHIRTLPMPETVREYFLSIRTLPDQQVVGIIELVSPANKSAGTDGYREYQRKREQVLQSEVHLVEIDLLLSGARLATVEPLPVGDYYVYVARGGCRPLVEVYGWRVGERMPVVPVPLLEGDADVTLDLQAVYEEVYRQGRYDILLGSEEKPY